MALSTQAANLVWQKVDIALNSASLSAPIRQQFAALKAYLSQVKGNRDLEFVAFTDAGITGADGVVIADAACKLYAVFVQKDGTSGTGTATDSFVKAFDNATVDTTATDGRVVIPLLVAARTGVYFDHNGLDMAAGIVATAHTTYAGSTDSTAGDAGPGFIILGAA